jgi:Skp family chaperone for outer membrane proteins
MKKALVLAAMAAALTAVAEMKFGTVNMVDLVRLHPNHESNRTLVKTTDAEYKAKLDAKQDELKEIADEGKKAQSDLQNPMLSAQARAAAQKKLEGIQQRFLSGCICLWQFLQDRLDNRFAHRAEAFDRVVLQVVLLFPVQLPVDIQHFGQFAFQLP